MFGVVIAFHSFVTTHARPLGRPWLICCHTFALPRGVLTETFIILHGFSLCVITVCLKTGEHILTSRYCVRLLNRKEISRVGESAKHFPTRVAVQGKRGELRNP
jgi:hypothetical protein